MSSRELPPPSDGPAQLFLTRSERAEETSTLLEAAVAATTSGARRAALEQVVRLNLDLVSALTMAVAKRYRATTLDTDALLDHVHAIYTEAVLGLERAPSSDLVVWLTPIVRHAVMDFVRRSTHAQQPA